MARRRGSDSGACAFLFAGWVKLSWRLQCCSRWFCLDGLCCSPGGARSFPSAVSLGCMLALAGRYLIRRERTVHTPPMEEALEEGQRRPALYLRAFNQESQFFIMGSKELYGRWAKSFHAAISKSDQKIGLTLEEYLGKDLSRSIGPFVALGSPEDYLAPPALYAYMQRMTSGRRNSRHWPKRRRRSSSKSASRTTCNGNSNICAMKDCRRNSLSSHALR